MILLSHWMNASTPLYGGKVGIEITPCKEMHKGDSCNSFDLSFNNHSGTHIDLPFHFVSSGEKISDWSPAQWSFDSCAVVDVLATPGKLLKDLSALSNVPHDTDLLLLRTGFEKKRGTQEYWENGPGLAPETAQPLRDRYPKLRAIGFDFLSATSYQHRELGRQAHREFLNRGLCLIEDMKLSNAPQRISRVIVAPLLVEGIDGAPVTVFAFP